MASNPRYSNGARRRAILRALGIPVPEPAPTVGTIARADRRYDGLAWCFANHGSPMDAR